MPLMKFWMPVSHEVAMESDYIFRFTKARMFERMNKLMVKHQKIDPESLKTKRDKEVYGIRRGEIASWQRRIAIVEEWERELRGLVRDGGRSLVVVEDGLPRCTRCGEIFPEEQYMFYVYCFECGARLVPSDNSEDVQS